MQLEWCVDMRHYKIEKLIQAWKKHQMDNHALSNIFAKFCHGEIAQLSEEEKQLLIERKEQLGTMHYARMNGAMINAFEKLNAPVIEFIVENGFNTYPLSPLIFAPLYGPGMRNRSEYVTQIVKRAMQIPGFVKTLCSEETANKEAFLRNIIHFLPHSPTGAEALRLVLDNIGSALEPYLITLLHTPYLGWAPHLADTVFAHPATRRLFYKEYAPDYEARSTGLLNWHELTQRSLINYKALDKRIAQERKKLAANGWRALFWGAIVLQWRKRDFVERYYAPGGAGTQAAAARFYESVAKEQTI